MPRIDLSRQAAEFLEKLPAKQARQIAEKLKSLESDPSGLPTGALKGYSPLRRFQLARPEIPVSGGPCLCLGLSWCCLPSERIREMLYRSQVETIVDDVLREHLGGHGFAKADIGYEEDFDGEEIIRVTAHLDTPFEDVRVMMEAADAIRVRLLDEDDTRYVFLSQNYPGAGDRHGDADQLAGSVVS